MSIQVPDFPVIAWEFPIDSAYYIRVTRNSVSHDVLLNPNIASNDQGNYLVRGFGIGGFLGGDPETHHLAAVLAEAIEHVLQEPSGVTTRLPTGGFNLGGDIVVNGSYTGALLVKNFPTVTLTATATNPLIWSLSIDVEFAVLAGPEASNFGFTSTLPVGERTWPVLGFGNDRVFSMNWPNTAVWAPNNYICYEDRNYLRDTILNSSAFDRAIIRTVNWSDTREQILMEYPVVPAEWIFLYRRDDPAFAVTTSVLNPNNLLQGLWEYSQTGGYFWLYLNDTDPGERMTSQDEDFMTDMSEAIEDATSRGRAFDVNLTFVSAP